MKKTTTILFAFFIIFSIIACDTRDQKEKANTQDEKPSVAQLHAYKAVHHANYLKTTAAQASGTNKLIHTKELPTEGTDPVATPALDHLYTKAVNDLTNGPVVVEMPKVADDRYYSIHITDQEHYTIYDEVRPVGKYVFVRKGKDIEIPEGAKVRPGMELQIRWVVKTVVPKPRLNGYIVTNEGGIYDKDEELLWSKGTALIIQK